MAPPASRRPDARPPRPAPPDAGPQGRVRAYFLLAALGYLVFVVYGSLVPLQFTRVPWDEALQRFRNIPYLELGIDSRADWVANLLLFIPLVYLWLGALWVHGRPAWNLFATLALAVLASALSLGIEFVQIFFPPRTVSINDIVAETAGAVIGLGLWWWTGPALLRWLQARAETRGALGWATRVLQVYLFGLFAYGVMPLDLTISPVEIYHKWNSGRVVLVPFSFHYATLADAVYDLGADILIWVPVAMLWRVPGRLSAAEVVLRVGGAAALLEVLQLFVYTRVTSTTDVLTAMAGGLIGVVLGGRLARPAAAGQARSRGPGGWGPWALGVVAWLVVIVFVFWYPFDVRTDRAFVTERLQGLWRVPFVTYYFGTEYRAITEVLHKTLFFAPGGALLAWAVWRVPAGALRGFAMLATGVLLSAAAGTVELVQVVLPGKVPDPTDWALETLGGLLGAAVVWVWLTRRAAETATAAQAPRAGPSAAGPLLHPRGRSPGARP